MGNASSLKKMVAEQESWIKKCGGTLEGYRQHYGDPDMDHSYGDGGTAIFEADVGHLKALDSMLRDAEAKLAPPRKSYFRGPNKGLRKYLHETEQVLVVDDLGGGAFTNPRFIDGSAFGATRERIRASRAAIFGLGDDVDLVEVVVLS